MHVRFTWCALILGLAASLVPAQRKALEDLAPADTAIFVKLRDVAAIRPFIDGTHAVYQEAFVKKLIAEYGVGPAMWNEMFQKETGLVLGDLLGALEGPVAVGITPIANAPVPRILVLFGVKSGESTDKLWKQVLSKIETSIGGEARSAEDDVAGTPLWHVDVKKSDERTESVYACMRDGVGVFASVRKDAESVIHALKGSEVPALTGREDFGAAVARLGTARDVVAWADFPKLVAFGLAEKHGSRDSEDASATDRKMLSALGLDSLKSLAAGVGLNEKAFEVALYAHAPGKRSGLLALLSPEGANATPDRFVPADVQQASVFWVDFPKLLGRIRGIVEAVDAESAEGMDEMIGQLETQLGVDIQKDLLEPLTPPLTMMDFAPPADAPQRTRMLVMSRSPEAKRFVTAVTTICEKMMGLSIEPKESMGHTIHEVSEEVTGEEVGPISLAATDTHILLSVGGRDLIEQAFRTMGQPAKPLTETTEYRRALEGFPPNRWITTFARLDVALEKALTILKEGAALAGEAGEAFRMLAGVDAKTILKYVDLVGACAASDASGLYFGLRVTRPPAPAKTGGDK